MGMQKRDLGVRPVRCGDIVDVEAGNVKYCRLASCVVSFGVHGGSLTATFVWARGKVIFTLKYHQSLFGL